jgi:uncharacterized membrane protein
MRGLRSSRAQFIAALLLSSGVSLGLYAYGIWRNQAANDSYLLWNLFLAWLPLVFALQLAHRLKHKLWSSWECLTLSVLWLLFLPNSFYLVSDFIHLQEGPRPDILYDAVMFTAFIYTGVILGFTSLYLVHLQLRRRLSPRLAAIWVGVTLFLCSVAIYIGRDLRWNSWDVVTNPGGLLFDVSDRLQRFSDYPHMLVTISAFFVLLASVYNVLWRGLAVLRHR